MGRLEGKVAFISGVARGQGRSHAVRLAQEGCDIIGFDLCEQLESVEYPMSTPADLGETVRLVEATGRRIIARKADVRDPAGIEAVLSEGIVAMGRLDIVLANAGIMPVTGDQSKGLQAWHDAVDVMLTGVYLTVEAAIPALLSGGRGGSIVITSSTAGLKGLMKTRESASPGSMGYTAAKHGVVGLMRAYANSLGAHGIRVNSVHPTGVNSPMVVNEAFGKFVAENPETADSMQNVLPVELIECEDISNAIVWLCSEEGRYVTGVTLPVDAGFTAR